MSEQLLFPQLAPSLERLKSLWPWGRKALVLHIQQQVAEADEHSIRMRLHLQASEAELLKINGELGLTNTQLGQLQSSHQQLQTEHVEQTRQLFERTHKHNLLTQAHTEQQAMLAKLQTEHTDQTQQLLERTNEHNLLIQAHAKQQAELEELQAIHVLLDAAHTQLQALHSTLEETHGQLHHDHAELGQRLAARNNAYEQLQTEHEQLRQQAEQHLTKLQQTLASLGALQEQHAQLQQAHSALLEAQLSLQEDHEQLRGDHCKLSEDAELVKKRYSLVCNILNSKPAENPALAELKTWLAESFAQDVQRLELPADITTAALQQGQSIGLHVELLSHSPALRNKFLVAVAGGFSSGKSSFVTSFMRKDESQLLAKGIQPVTAIPTYVMPGSALSIQGHTSKGAHVELSREEYAELTHDFISNMGFNVKDVMPHVIIESPMPSLEHLAFVDMPGYDPAASASADTLADRGTASAALSEAHAVIWLVALDSNGTLPANDLEFLVNHADNRPLYVVLNKADLRPLSALRDVLDEIQQHLEDYDLPYEGISAYSSENREEILYYGKSLNEIMQEWDRPSSAEKELHKEFDAVVTALEQAFSQQHRKGQEAHDLLHSLELDFMQMVGSEAKLFQTARERLGQLKTAIAETSSDDALDKLENMRKRGHELLRDNCDTDHVLLRSKKERIQDIASTLGQIINRR